MTETAEYKTWCGMKRRCYNQNEPCYPRYGGRGIKVCDRWLHSFENFLSDMGQRPSNKHSIERIDPNKDYEPTNCTWLPLAEQALNRRNSVRLTFQGQTRPLMEWSALTGIPYSALQARLARGWSHEKALSTRLAVEKRNHRQPKNLQAAAR